VYFPFVNASNKFAFLKYGFVHFVTIGQVLPDSFIPVLADTVWYLPSHDSAVDFARRQHDGQCPLNGSAQPASLKPGQSPRQASKIKAPHAYGPGALLRAWACPAPTLNKPLARHLVATLSPPPLAAPKSIQL
jgi:hypothetical protein